MPRKRRVRRRVGRGRKKYPVARRRGRKQRGGSFMSFLKSANKWLRKNKVLSKAGKALDTMGVPYAGKAGKVAGVLGYGRSGRKVRRRRRRGRGPSLAGGRRGKGVYLAGRGSSLAGGRKKRCPRSGIAY